MQRIFAVRRVE